MHIAHFQWFEIIFTQMFIFAKKFVSCHVNNLYKFLIQRNVSKTALKKQFLESKMFCFRYKNRQQNIQLEISYFKICIAK